MARHNAANEYAKRAYIVWLRNTCGRSEDTLDGIAAAIDRFQTFNRHRDFKAYRPEQAISFKQHLADQRSARTGKPLSKSTIVSTLNAVRTFFDWLAREPGYRSRIRSSDVAYFRPTNQDVRIATAKRSRPAPSLHQVQNVIAAMPADTTVQRRDRAVVALILLTGARDKAVASLPLKRLDLASRLLHQDGRDEATKGRKTFSTWFFPVGDAVLDALAIWVRELQVDLLFGPDDPLFPATQMSLDSAGQFAPSGVERKFWTTAGPIRRIFQAAFRSVGIPNYGPHSLRRTLVQVAYERKLAPRSMKAWSQNLGHESLLTTYGSYGTLSDHEQGDVIASLWSTSGGDRPAEDEELERLARLVLARRSAGDRK